MDTTLHDPLIGQVIDGRYHVDQRIAVGGMATVYRATDRRLDRVVALKVMHPTLAGDDAFVERFTREARAAARLDHPNIVGVLDQGTDAGYVYLVMEYVAGCTLRDLLRERGALQPRAVLDIAEPMLAGLGAAHRAGLVHRDMKPENVLIGEDGRVKVADFGLVRGVDSHTSASTDEVLGTVAYLAPEQIERGQVDARADVFACGVLLYEMLTGAKPHAGDTAAQVLYARVNRDLPLPSEAVAGLPAELDGLVGRAAARDPGGRPTDAAALLTLVRGVRAALSDEQLDAASGVPGVVAAAPEVGPEDRTRIVPLPKGVRATAPDAAASASASASASEEQTSRTSRIDPVLASPPILPPLVDAEEEPYGEDPGAGPRGTRMPRRRLLTLIGAALLLLSVGVGVWYINSGQFLRVPGVYGLARAEAEERLRDAGLDVRVERDFSRSVEAGHVIATDPERGERVRRNSTVTITVSEGPPVAVVPNLRGIPLEEAKRQLADEGLTAGAERREFSEEVPRGSVIDTDPAPGEERPANTAVDLIVSRGAEIDVPDVVGVAEGTAMQTLREAGFEVEVAGERIFSEEEAGTVAAQTPAPGASAGEGDTIVLTISKGPEMIVVPDVRGRSEEEATDILQDAGFEVNVNQLFFTGTVFNQSIYGGDRAPRGSTITIWVR